MRCFIAINLPQEVKAYLEDLILHVEKNNYTQKIKYNEPENLHLTLSFIEEIDEPTLEKLKSRLAEIKIPNNLFLELDSLGGFPSKEKPRVVKVSLAEDGKQLIEIKKQLNSILAELNIPIENREFSPHITIGRIKHLNSRLKLKQTIDHLSFQVKSIDLMKSKLTPAGPIYSLLKSIS